MACLLKAPDGVLKGCVTFTTQERDLMINKSAELRDVLQALKGRYVIGLHHNWHDHAFRYDPLFDFSMAGDGDLIEADGRDFARIPLDACNFAPPCYSAPRGEQFWDILYVARAAAFKGIPQFFASIRALYDQGRRPRALFICPYSDPVEIPGISSLRRYFEQTFSAEERQRITFLTIDWDYPFPFDADSLAFFYRSSRVFFHPAPEERRCRTAAYAWAGRMPVVCSGNVASILPKQLHRQPFLFEFGEAATAEQALMAALDRPSDAAPAWNEVSAEFSAKASARRAADLLDKLSVRYGWGALSSVPINDARLDIRLGRHHDLSMGANRIDMPIAVFCDALITMPDETIRSCCATADPELSVQEIGTAASGPGAAPRFDKTPESLSR